MASIYWWWPLMEHLGGSMLQVKEDQLLPEILSQWPNLLEEEEEKKK